MRPLLFVAVVLLATLLIVACSRNENENAKTVADVAPAEIPAPQPAPQADIAMAPVPPVAADPPAPAPPAPVVEGMYVTYHCDNSTQPKITFSGNLVKVQFNANAKPIILSARASATNMSDTYVGETLTLHRDGLGITLDHGRGTTTRCVELQASA